MDRKEYKIFVESEDGNSLAQLAGAGINILSVVPLPKPTDEYVTVLVCYEFQHKSRGNYAWTKAVQAFTMYNLYDDLITSDMEELQGGRRNLWHNLDGLTKPTIDLDTEMVPRIIEEVILARDVLEEDGDRGFYRYYWVPDDLPEHIKVVVH